MTDLAPSFLRRIIFRNSLLYALSGILFTLLFILDINIELGVSSGTPYAIIILLGLLQSESRYFLWAGLIAAALTVAGYYLSPAGGEEWKVLMNRGYSIFVIVSMSSVCFFFKRMDHKIKDFDKQIDNKFKQNTLEQEGFHKKESDFKEIFFEKLSGNMEDGLVIINEAGIVQSINPAVKEMFQYEPQEVIGKNVSMLMPEPYRKEHDEYIQNYVKTGKAKIIGIGREVSGEKKDGSVFPLSIAIMEVFDEDKRSFIGIARDISERDNLKRNLKSEALYVKQLYQIASVVNETQSFDEAVQFCLKKICSLAEWQVGHFYIFSKEMNKFISSNNYYCVDINSYIDFVAETQGKSFSIGEGLPGRVYESRKYELIQDVGEDNNFPRKNMARNSNIKGAFALPLFVKKEVYGVVEFFSNKPIKMDQKLLEIIDNIGMQMNRLLERKEYEHQLKISRDQAEMANKAKSEFLSRMSHELRTPLNSILGYSQFMLMDTINPLNETQKLNTEKISGAGQHLLQLINEILDLSKIESGKLDSNIESVKLNELIKECVVLSSPLSWEQKIIVEDELSSGDTVFLNADRLRLKQVILNLLSNGIKYNEKNGYLKIYGKKLDNDMFRICFTDTGRGLTAEQQVEVFKPFTRLEDGNAEIVGTGIGLPISRKLVETMGGRLDVESIKGEGSTFYFDLPAADEEPAIEKNGNVILNEMPESLGSRKAFKILYIEDNVQNLDLVRQLMSQFKNVQLLSASDALLGIDIARHQKIDLVLMDINLPGIDGFEAFRILKNHPEVEDTPVLAVSANAMQAEIDKALEMGFQDYITKPIDVKRFMEKVKSYMDEPESAKKN